MLTLIIAFLLYKDKLEMELAAILLITLGLADLIFTPLVISLIIEGACG